VIEQLEHYPQTFTYVSCNSGFFVRHQIIQVAAKLLDKKIGIHTFGPAMNEPDAVGRSSVDGRAPFTDFYLRIRDDRIEHVEFQTFGCAFSKAACAVVTELIKGRTTDDCLAVCPEKVLYCLGHVPEEKRFCIDLAVNALHDAIQKWRDRL
jgi:hypothetical protein